MKQFWAALFLIMTSCAPAPVVTFAAANTPADLQDLATDVFHEFATAFPAQSGCMGEVTVEGRWELRDRAVYLPGERRVQIRIPATAAHLRNSLLHEFAHHIEATCPQDEQMRDAFISAQGLTDHANWVAADTWETTPSEVFAEAVIEYVAGSRTAHRSTHIQDDAIVVVANWAGGDHVKHAP